MRFDFNFYSSLLLIPFSQGIFYATLLFKKAIVDDYKSNYWLSLFLFLCSLYIAPWMLGFAGWYDNQPYRDFMFYMPFQHLFFLGPVLYFYVQSLLNPVFKLNSKLFFHFIPGILYLLYNGWIFAYDQIILGEYYYYADGADKDFDSWYQSLGFFSMFIYLLLSIKFYKKYRLLIVQLTSNADALLFIWVKKYLFAFLAMLLLKLFFEVYFSFFPEHANYIGTWWSYLFFSIILFYICINGYANSSISKIGFEVSPSNKEEFHLIHKNHIESETININSESLHVKNLADLEVWKSQIVTLIEKEKLYENPELNLTEISRKLNTNVNVISKAINQGFNMNFNGFSNNYRIEAVKKSFETGALNQSTIIGIAYNAGFNSKATFNRAFKKNTGYTPKEFIDLLQK
jgi:AraC-like DNA-binding protein